MCSNCGSEKSAGAGFHPSLYLFFCHGDPGVRIFHLVHGISGGSFRVERSILHASCFAGAFLPHHRSGGLGISPAGSSGRKVRKKPGLSPAFLCLGCVLNNV